jgi:hypothetical protein
MNKLVKIEIWDDDFTKDQIVGIFHINFDDIYNKTMGPQWVNLYGPPLIVEEDNEYSDLMICQGDKGSTYRGRLLYSV